MLLDIFNETINFEGEKWNAKNCIGVFFENFRGPSRRPKASEIYYVEGSQNYFSIGI